MIINNRGNGICQTTVYSRTMTPFLKDNTTFLFNVFRGHLDAMAPVTEHPKHILIKLRIIGWYVMNGITRIINTCESLKVIEIVTAKEVHHTIREVVCRIESQMLQHVRQSHFLIILQDSTYILVEVVLCLTSSRTIIIDIISKSICQFPLSQSIHLRIGRIEGKKQKAYEQCHWHAR